MKTAQQNLMPLVFAIDRQFLSPLVKALRSLARVYTEAEALEVHVLHANALNSKDVSRLKNAIAARPKIGLTVHSVGGFVKGRDAEANHAAYSRLAIPQIFAGYTQVIYLDADIMFAKSPYQFCHFKLSDNFIIAACQDVQNPTLGSGIALPGWQSLGLRADQPYFNSGVMVISPRRWTKANITELAVNFVQSSPQHLRFRDQDALNFLLRDKWQSLPHKWNYPPLSAILKVPGAKYYAEDFFPLNKMLAGEARAVIFHFVGPDKPWDSSFPACPIADLYQELTS